jgi:hypothetical protein
MGDRDCFIQRSGISLHSGGHGGASSSPWNRGSKQKFTTSQWSGNTSCLKKDEKQGEYIQCPVTALLPVYHHAPVTGWSPVPRL